MGPWAPETERFLGVDPHLTLQPADSSFALERRVSEVLQFKILVRRQGILSISGAQLRAAGWPRTPLLGSEVRLTHRGRDVATWASSEGLMSDRDHIWFYAEGISTDHTDTRVYWLGPGEALRMQPVAQLTDGLARDSYRAEVVIRTPELHAHSFLPAFDFDHWFAGRVTEGAAFDREILIEDPLTEHTVTASLRAAAERAQWWEDENRPLSLRVNDQDAGTLHYASEGRTVSSKNYNFQPFRVGLNRIELSLKGADSALIRDVTIRYQRPIRVQARGDLCFSSDRYPGRWQTQGFEVGQDWFLDVTDRDRPLRLQPTEQGELGLAPERVVYLCQAAAVEAASLKPGAASPDFLRGDLQFDYVVVTDTARFPNAARLAEHRAARGLRTTVLNLNDIYDHFGYGYRTPMAIRRCLGTLWKEGGTRLRFVVLLGDGVLDARSRMGGSRADDVVPVVLGKGAFERTPHDHYYVSIHGDDLLPDIALGRLPFQTPEQLDDYMIKLDIFEREGLDAPAMKRSLFVADTQDFAGDFKGLCEELRTEFFEGHAAETAYQDHLPVETVHARVAASLKDGTHGFVVYNGHGFASSWGTGILNAQEVNQLSNTHYPIVTALACSTGGFHQPDTSIAEALVRQRHGAIAVVAATSLTTQFNSEKLSQGMFGAMHRKEVATLGEAMLLGRRNLAYFASRAPSLQFYHLIGDPALLLAREEERIEVELSRGRGRGGLWLSWNSEPGGVYQLSICGDLERAEYQLEPLEYIGIQKRLSIPMPGTAHTGCGFRVLRLR